MNRSRIAGFVVGVVVAVMSLAACAQKEKNVGLWSSEGTLEFEQRQTIEDYQIITEAKISSFIADLARQTQGIVQYYDDAGLGGCGRVDVDGWIMDSRSYRLPIVDEDTVIKLADKHLVPAGLTERSEARSPGPNGNVNFTWNDQKNGGYVSVTFVPDHQVIRISYASDCRPSDGSTKHTDQFHPNRGVDSAFTNLTVEILEE